MFQTEQLSFHIHMNNVQPEEFNKKLLKVPEG